MSRPHYDVAILGAGLAGLSLAVRLADPKFAGLRVLVADPRTSFGRDRTWSYWALRPHPFAAAVAASWDRWAVIGNGREVVCHAPGLRYETIHADALYRLALERLRAAPNVDLRLGVGADAVEGTDGVLVRLGPDEIGAALAFDTRPTPELGRHGLTQMFLGQEIETERPVFDPLTATLMDFRCAQSGAAHFTYVLPTSPRHALVEDTWFAPVGHRPPDHRRAIRDHMAERHDVDRFEVLFEEQGALPMDPVFRPRPGRRLLPLGSPSGANRPSTGYAFNAIQASCDAIAADLAAGRHPAMPRPRPALTRMMDSILLHLIEARPEQAPRVFAALFARCPPGALVRFLNDAAGAADFVAVAMAIPFAPVMGAAGRLAAGRLASGGMRWATPG